MRSFFRRFGRVLSALVLLLLFVDSPAAFAQCSTKWVPNTKTALNEYYSFGSQFLEIYSTDKNFPSTWSTDGLSIEVYSKSGSSIAKNVYNFNASNSFACTKSGKTWLTMPNVTGLTNGEGMAVLKDSTGIIDAFAFFNGGNVNNLAVWIDDTNNWYRTYNGGTSLNCSTLSSALTAQSLLITAGTSTSEDNFVRGSSSNKGLARYPDGVGNSWTDTDLTGAGSTFTTCTTNNANLIKTVDRATVPPNSTVRFSLTVANSSSSSLNGGTITITDTLPEGMTFVSATSSQASSITLTTPTANSTVGASTNNTITWTPSTITASGQAVLTITMTVPSDAAIGHIYTNTAVASGSAVSKPQSDSASVTVIAPTTPSFLVTSSRQNACTDGTVSSSTPVITLTAKDQANGTGNTLGTYTGTVTLTSSSSTARWTKKTGGGTFTQIGSGGTYTFVAADAGVAEFYLTNTAPQSVDLFVYDYTTFSPSEMTGLLSPIEYSPSTCSTTLPLVSIAPTSFTEGNSNTARTFTVSLTNPTTATSAVTVNYSTVSGTAIGGFDFTAVTNGVVSIPIGSSSGTASVTIIGDTDFEGSETFQVVLSNPVNAQLGTSSAIGTILDDDTPRIRAKYRMDESTWTTGAQSALDSGPNVYHATIAGNLTKSSSSPAYTSGTSTDNTCGYGIFDAASSSYLTLPAGLLTLPNTGRQGFTVTGWIKPDSGTGTQPIIGVSGDWNISLTGTSLSFSKSGSNAITFTTAVGGSYSGSTISTNVSALSSGSWHYFALTLDKSTRTIVLYTFPATTGAAAFSNRVTATYSSTTDWIAPTSGAMAIGGTPAGATNFKGQIDEINIYDDTLPQSYVEQIRIDSRPCVAGVDHYTISHGGTALTCAAEAVTFTAHNASHVRTDAGSKTLALTTSTSSGSWLASADGCTQTCYNTSGTAQACAGTLTPTSGNNGQASYLFATGESGVRLCLRHATTGTVNINVTDGTASESSGAASGESTSADPNLVFSDAGLIFTASSSTNEATIPAQTAGVDFPATYYLRAVKTDKVTGACAPALTSSRPITLNYACDDPSACVSGTYMKLGATSFGSTSGTTTNLAFDSNGYSTTALQFAYLDVGTIHLTASTTSDAGVNLSGSSNNFLVKPYGFSVIACTGATPCSTANSAASDGTGAVFAKAGQAFNATVRAIANGNTITPNFGLGTGKDSEHVRLTHTLVAPSGGQAGTLAGTGVNGSCTPAPQTGCLYRSAFSGGVASVTDLSWSEVGVITLTATSSAFQSVSHTATGTSGNIGRFQPDHFETAVTGPMSCGSLVFSPACPAGGLAYAGQPFQTDVTAYAVGGSSASATGKIANYVAPFARTLTLTAWDASGSTTTQNPGSGTLTSGTITYSAAQARTTSSSYAFGTALTAPTSAYLRAIDSDSPAVSSLRATPSDSVEGGIKIISGRLRLGSAFGSEKLALTLPLYLEYWTGSYWATNTADSLTQLLTTASGSSSSAAYSPAATASAGASCFGVCTSTTAVDTSGSSADYGGSLLVTRASSTQALQASSSTPQFPARSPDSTTFAAGILSVQLPAPNLTGALNLQMEVPPWLKVNGANPTAQATFGIFNSNAAKRYIYRRESY